jgi:thiol-disulfide isomerase/thioredoxin
MTSFCEMLQSPYVVVGGIVLLILVILLIRRCMCAAGKKGKESFKLNSGTVGPYPDVFTMFKADWCGHCKKAMPEFEKAADMLKDSGVIVKKVDVDQSPKEVKDAGVSSFPTFILEDGATGEKKKYTGPRKAEDMAKFVESKGTVAPPPPSSTPPPPSAPSAPSSTPPPPSAMRPPSAPAVSTGSPAAPTVTVVPTKKAAPPKKKAPAPVPVPASA